MVFCFLRKKIDVLSGGRYAWRMRTATQLIGAIERNDVVATSDTETGGPPEIVLLIKGQAFCRLGCSTAGSPVAEVVEGNVVKISQSPGLKNGFQITCPTTADATLIADALQGMIDGEYPKLFGGPSSSARRR